MMDYATYNIDGDGNQDKPVQRQIIEEVALCAFDVVKDLDRLLKRTMICGRH